MNTKQLMTVTLAGMVAAAFSANTLAANEDHSKDEKCAGVVKAGKNDCSTSRNACHGHVNADSDSEAWVWVPMGTCDKIVGARVTSQKTPDGD